MPPQLEAGALPVRSPLYRQRPWVSDAIWIAHESHPLFGRLAAIMPSPGRWTLVDGGAEHTGLETPDLAGMMATLVATSTPCVVHHDTYERADSMEAAAAQVGNRPPVEVLDPDGRAWLFDHDIVEGAAGYIPGWSWRIALHRDRACLVGFDRKDRPRFCLAALEPQ